MIRKILFGLLFCSLALNPGSLDAGKTYSSGGSSYKSSSSSSGKSYSSSSKSYSSPSSSGKSYSSSRKSSSSPSYKSSSGKTYSSGSPSTSSSKSGYSSSPTRSTPSTSTPSYSSSSGRSYSSGAKSSSSAKPETSKKPSSGGWFDELSHSGKEQDSKNTYSPPSPPPAPPKISYKTPTGATREYDYGGSSEKLKESVNYDRYQRYDNRNRETFSRYANQPIAGTTTYNDPINIWFWMWLMDQSLDSKANWAYNHRSEIDDARYNELLAKNVGLKEKIAELEKTGVNKNTGYVPPGLENDPDLQYNKDYVEQVTNPVNWDSIFFWSSVIVIFCVFAFFFFIKNYA